MLEFLQDNYQYISLFVGILGLIIGIFAFVAELKKDKKKKTDRR